MEELEHVLACCLCQQMSAHKITRIPTLHTQQLHNFATAASFHLVALLKALPHGRLFEAFRDLSIVRTQIAAGIEATPFVSILRPLCVTNYSCYAGVISPIICYIVRQMSGWKLNHITLAAEKEESKGV
jgi:hypothetical protein